MFMGNVDKAYELILEIDRLKAVFRNNTTVKKRRESTAEHSWSVCLILLILLDDLKKEFPKIDELRLVKLGLIHDLGEIDAGDIMFFETKARIDGLSDEIESISKLAKIKKSFGKELKKLWEEFEERKTIEAKIAKAADAMCPMILRVRAKGYLSGRARHLRLSSIISGRSECIDGRLRGQYQKGAGSTGQATILLNGNRSRWTLGAGFDQRRRPSITEENISFHRDWASWLSSALGIIHRPCRTPRDDRLLMSCQAHLRPESATVVHLRLEADSERRRHVSWELGLDRWGRIAWGGGWADEWTPQGRRRWHLSLHSQLVSSGGAGIQGRAEIELNTQGDAQAYEIEIQQLGASCSPGLLFTKDPLLGVRNDGFIRFRF